MRVIAGLAKGRRLRAPKGSLTRPLTDRAKEGIFSSISHLLEGAAVLDLYAGSGSIGLEALSRGAASAVFVESRRDAVRVIRENVDAVGLGGVIEASTVEAFLGRSSSGFDLVFVDPPYDLVGDEVDSVVEAAEALMVPGASMIVHRRHGSSELETPRNLAIVDRRRYGDAEITRFAKEATA